MSVKTNEEYFEKIGELKDKVDNLLGSMELPMSADFHVKMMKSELATISNEVKNIYIGLTGDNPWDE